MGLVKSFQVFGIGNLRFSNSTLLTQIADSHASIPVQVGTGFGLQIPVLNFGCLLV